MIAKIARNNAGYMKPSLNPIRLTIKVCVGKDDLSKMPDLDNQIKLIMDSLNGIAYKDDSQVVCIGASRVVDIKFQDKEFTTVMVDDLSKMPDLDNQIKLITDSLRGR